MKYRYSVTTFRKIAVINKHARVTHRWKKVGVLYAPTKAEAMRYMKSWCIMSWNKATLRKED